MKNSNGDNFTENDPMSETEFGSEKNRRSAQDRLQEGARKISSVASDTWDQTRQKAVVVRERTEFFLRENPVPTVLGALALGLAIGDPLIPAAAQLSSMSFVVPDVCSSAIQAITSTEAQSPPTSAV
jgi:ElaB/YqjD/DUF883 family membrane-anchored ribosome-binding protein